MVFQIAPLEHYHTLFIDEKYQNHEFINCKSEYWRIRKDLIEMLFDTGKKLRQTISTVYLAISYMDIILNTVNLISQTLPPHSYKVIAVVCLNVASKFDALDLNTPIINELQRASGCWIVYAALLKYEAEVLVILNWNLNNVTLFHVLDAIKQQGIIFSDDTKNNGESIENDLDDSLNKAISLLDYFKDVMIKDVQWSIFKPSLQAAAWIIATRKLLGIDVPFSKTLSHMLLITREEIPEELTNWTQFLVNLLEIPLNPGEIVNLDLSDLNCNALRSDLRVRVESLQKLHDYEGRTFTRIRTCKSVYSSEDSAKYSDEDINVSNGEGEEHEGEQEAGYFYYGDNVFQLPLDLNEEELSYIEESIQAQMMYGYAPLAPIRSASADSGTLANYKAKISTLISGNTKGGTSDKENFEDINNEESALFDAEYESSNNERSEKWNAKKSDEKLKKQREKRKEKKKRRKLRKQAEKEKLKEQVNYSNEVSLVPELVVA
jgi:hypothetical protein